MNLISVCVYNVSGYRGKRESESKNVQLCQQQVDSSKPYRVFYLCRQELHWTVALFPRRPQSETRTLCRHENIESTGNTLSSKLISMTTYRYRVYVSCRPVFSKYDNTRAERGEKVWNVECLVVETHSNYYIERSVSPVRENRIQQVRNEPRQQGSLRAHTRTHVSFPPLPFQVFCKMFDCLQGSPAEIASRTLNPSSAGSGTLLEHLPTETLVRSGCEAISGASCWLLHSKPLDKWVLYFTSVQKGQRPHTALYYSRGNECAPSGWLGGEVRTADPGTALTHRQHHNP
ncbi:hypothetical protein Q8A67_011977 [Cirrhinus molitorella]|uniref:Uncharacterized protein n=1 Tax=Cirrhinus molitorella TaxID=172907 RepID=A0AA88PTI1_9TELE|nr:hypothetical protein Q8A67_011977 [Cirrhinus molitorella]